MLYFSILFISLSVIYALTLLFFRRGLRKLKAGKSKNQPKVSIVIAARNEEKHIHRCISAIINQKYPKHRFEIIVIDDRSEDRTAEIVKNLAIRYERIKLLQIHDTSPHLAPKKRAIDLGIRHATGDIIVTTDADCKPGPFWISTLMKYFEPSVGMVAGFNPYKIDNSKNNLFHQMLALDYFAMACVAAATAGLSFPISCSGGNLAYRKDVYFQIGGFRNISNWISGDDDFLLEQLREKTTWKIRYATNPKTFVSTEPPENVKAFIHQRIRYASKGRHYKLSVTLGLFSVYLLNFLLLLGLFLLLIIPQLWPVWLSAFTIKTLAEYTFLCNGQNLFQIKFHPSVFFLTALLHPIYIVLAGLIGQFANFQWKGENYSAQIKSKSTYLTTKANYFLNKKHS